MTASTENLVIRQPCEGEAEELAKLHLNTWEEAYTGLLPSRF